jgi:hypothetical protein
MAYDFNDAESNSGSYELIPAGTVAPMIMTIRPGAVGDGGWLSTSDTSQYKWLNCEFAITDGPFRGRKVWQNMMIEGPSEEAINITRSTLRGILESARGIKANDDSAEAKAKRVINNYGDFSGMEFTGKIGIEKSKNPAYPDDKNRLLGAVAGEAKTTAAKPAASKPAANNDAAAKPAWAA